MATKLTLWNRIPVVIRAIVIGSLVFFIGSTVWSVLVGLNLKVAASLPWAVAVNAIFSFLYWRYLSGKGWPRSTSEARRAYLRVGRLSGIVWAWSLTAGVLGVASAVSLQLVYACLVRVPVETLPDLSRYSAFVVVSALLMSAVVAGFAEEAGFRGYMQVPLEQRYGPVVASAIVAIMFGLWHFSHGPAFTVPRLPYYFLVSIIYSTIAYRSKSLMPAVAIHVCGDGIEFLYVWMRGMPEQQPLLWQKGPDAIFWTELGLGLIFGCLAIFAFGKLSAVSRRESFGVGLKALDVELPKQKDST